MQKKIVTISRQYGSGGRYIGKKLSEKLGIPCYDEKLIDMVAKESGFAQDFVAEKGERMTGSLLFNIASSLSYANNILSAMKGKKFIFNLGHGILPETPTENVKFLVECVKNGK